MNNNKRLPHTPPDTRHRIRELAYFRMIHESDLVCRQSTRMDRRTFAILCHLLINVVGLSSTEIVDVEEMVAMFLHVLAHDVKNCVIQREFNCLGALDGTYIKVNVPAGDRPTFRTRKGEIATNVLGVCDTKGDFVYVLAGWEGSAADSRILRYYYLCDAGYPNAEGFLVQDRGQRYHLQEWRGAANAPTNAKEYFNTKHSSTRNVIECAFGVLKDNDTFRPGYLAQLVRMMAEKLPGCQVRATTVIDCRIKTLKRTFQAIAEMQGPACSGSGWNDEEKCIIGKKELFDNWVRSHPAAKGLLNKSFLYYDELTYVFGRNRVISRFAETFADVGSNEPGGGYDRFDMGDGNEDFLPVYSQGIDLSQDDVRASRPSRASEGRTGSSGSKRKRESQQDFDVEAIHLALDQTNEQLRQIAEWPARNLANDNHVRMEFFRILREMPELTSLDRALLQRHLLSRMDDLRGFVLMPEDEREGFCRVLLRDIER
ncbi:retrotransposon protein [Cucumis melo var. makuwa]|uniref:Retrotransposon protein n=1 Tax=Cucumis melo var. makuwa TaxID=1194695 RepID=A0A5A7TS15_CUCMM|nr:retrotransposon protein [Cucumis melo var. makuwa]